MSAYGMICYDCDTEIEGDTLADVDRKAYEAGWQIGLKLSANAFYSCPECAPGLLACKPLYPIERRA